MHLLHGILGLVLTLASTGHCYLDDQDYTALASRNAGNDGDIYARGAYPEPDPDLEVELEARAGIDAICKPFPIS